MSLALAAALAIGTPGQEPDPRPAGRLAVFLDCGACDHAYVRTEIAFVSYVRDRESADVHVLVTTQRTASDGSAFTHRRRRPATRLCFDWCQLRSKQ